jgi:hypothetical protein
MNIAEYKKNVDLYLVSISIFEELLKKGELDQESFIKIEQKLLEKYGLNKRSIFRSIT